jgi:hypothetical protein
MIFGYFTLAVALLIEIVGAYYSITGLAAIFSGAVIPILIMGGSLEVGKVTAAVWLKNNWHRASMAYKVYLLPAVAILMVITSMGIFGFLSKAHNDQNLVSGDVMSKIAVYDEKIKTEKDNIEANRKALKQMDEGVDQVLGRSTDEKGADKAVALRRSQQKERARLQAEIQKSQQSIAQLNDARAPIAAEVRKVEAEVGPIKYIAKMIYGDDPDANILEKAVTWVIMIIVAVFDPLALVLILAAQQTLRWHKEELVDVVDSKPNDPDPQPVDELSESQLAEINAMLEEAKETADPDLLDNEPQVDKETVTAGQEAAAPEGEFFRVEQDARLAKEIARKDQELAQLQAALDEIVIDYSKISEQNNTSLERNLDLQIQVDSLKRQISALNNPMSITERPGDYVESTPEQHIPVIEPIENSEYVRVDGKVYGKDSLSVMLPELVPYADNAFKKLAGSRADFGTEFPATPRKGDLYLRIDYLPNKLYKWNGAKWLEIDKNSTDSYAYNERYIEHLVNQLNSGTYDADDLNDAERDQIEQYLKGRNAQ